LISDTVKHPLIEGEISDFDEIDATDSAYAKNGHTITGGIFQVSNS
jgi:hypothetical protein